MQTIVVTSILLVSASVLTHSAGLSWLLDTATSKRLMVNSLCKRSHKVCLLMLVFAVLICLHMIEAMIWASAYQLQKCFESFESSMYFSITTYTTLGSGDVELPHRLRMTGALESMLGVLMFGWSSGFVVYLLSKIYALEGTSVWHHTSSDHTRTAVSKSGIS